MDTKIFVMNSFAKTPDGGNPAGVVLSQKFSRPQMLNIAKEAGFSETAFIDKIDEKHYDIRYFTPCAEVDLCGHATIAAFSLLVNKKMISEGEYDLNTKAGKINITITQDNVFMTQNLPVFSQIIDKNEILQCFNIAQGDLISDLPGWILRMVKFVGSMLAGPLF